MTLSRSERSLCGSLSLSWYVPLASSGSASQMENLSFLRGQNPLFIPYFPLSRNRRLSCARTAPTATLQNSVDSSGSQVYYGEREGE